MSDRKNVNQSRPRWLADDPAPAAPAGGEASADRANAPPTRRSKRSPANSSEIVDSPCPPQPYEPGRDSSARIEAILRKPEKVPWNSEIFSQSSESCGFEPPFPVGKNYCVGHSRSTLRPCEMF